MQKIRNIITNCVNYAEERFMNRLGFVKYGYDFKNNKYLYERPEILEMQELIDDIERRIEELENK